VCLGSCGTDVVINALALFYATISPEPSAAPQAPVTVANRTYTPAPSRRNARDGADADKRARGTFTIPLELESIGAHVDLAATPSKFAGEVFAPGQPLSPTTPGTHGSSTPRVAPVVFDPESRAGIAQRVAAFLRLAPVSEVEDVETRNSRQLHVRLRRAGSSSQTIVLMHSFPTDHCHAGDRDVQRFREHGRDGVCACHRASAERQAIQRGRGLTWRISAPRAQCSWPLRFLAHGACSLPSLSHIAQPRSLIRLLPILCKFISLTSQCLSSPANSWPHLHHSFKVLTSQATGPRVGTKTATVQLIPSVARSEAMKIRYLSASLWRPPSTPRLVCSR
jgi:hypothetical protein